METAQIAFRLGSATDDALTPREKDLGGSPGSRPGLSIELTVPPVGKKVRQLDVVMLRRNGLKVFPDIVAEGGREGHATLAPVTDDGEVDQAKLQERASYRGTGQRHPFTQAVLDAILP